MQFCQSVIRFCFLFSFINIPDGWSLFLLSSITWGTTVTAITEGLSLFKQITFPSLAFAWIGLDIFAGLVLVNKIKKDGIKLFQKTNLDLETFDYLTLGGIAVIICITGVIAFVAPPNTGDSMTYHLSRVMHWIQDKSVSPYPTNISRQIYLTPWSEYAILQFQLLSGSDYLANVIQWYSFIGAIVGISLIARELGATKRGQIFSAAFAATIPMAILQASSTQTDLTTALWLVCFVFFCLHIINNKRWWGVIGVGSSLGLAVFSKGTAYFYAFPFVILMTIWIFSSKEKQKLWLWCISVLIVFGINSGQFTRNYIIYKNPLGPSEVEGYKFSNDIITPASIVSNFSRNLVLHISTPSNLVNQYIYELVYQFHSVIGFDINDPRTTWEGTLFSVPPPSTDEAIAENLIHLLFITAAFGYCLTPLAKSSRIVVSYILAVILGFLLFCAVLKWQPWNSRLHTSLFILSCAILGTVITQIKSSFSQRIIISLFFITALPCLIRGSPRTLIGSQSIFTSSRNQQYFVVRPDLFQPYTLAAQKIEQLHVSNVGLVTGWDDWEYPLWMYLGHYYKPLPRIEHVNVQNETSVISTQDPYYGLFVPDILVVTIPSVISNPNWQLKGKTYQRIWQSSDVIAIYIPIKP